MLQLSPHNAFLGAQLEAIDSSEVIVALPLRAEFIGNAQDRTLHGGVVTAMLDTACALAVMAKLGGPVRIATLDLRIDYLKPIRDSEQLFARCSCYKQTQQVAFVQGVAFTRDDNGSEDEVAKATGTFMIQNARGDGV